MDYTTFFLQVFLPLPVHFSLLFIEISLRARLRWLLFLGLWRFVSVMFSCLFKFNILTVRRCTGVFCGIGFNQPTVSWWFCLSWVRVVFDCCDPRCMVSVLRACLCQYQIVNSTETLGNYDWYEPLALLFDVVYKCVHATFAMFCQCIALPVLWLIKLDLACLLPFCV